ncbi:TIGR03790 family protein [Cerasicoccus arenae]|uniref:TIGR03790 family protein n=1 Tax=Cerasicoccus arenae TaxID=424488 RepID=A0A8J3GEI1_9BACT|nr:TIGR03790 family protein [Cerasicoccus arenae]MBK1858962.1 TIGR03790 family protein [Cerasicoccus arenae]GHC04115.1 hypothetical protein GCM10007047_20970 [Cerasicoccus arenae]
MRLFTLITWLAISARIYAIGPEDVVVVANENDPDSLAIAEYYMAKRDIPPKNLIKLSTTKAEAISGEQFFAEIFNPLRVELIEREWINGVLARDNDGAGRRKVVSMGHKIGYLVLCRLPYQIKGHSTEALEAFPNNLTGAMANSQSSVDSELSLLPLIDTPLAGPVNNPLFQQKKPSYMALNSIVRIARLDGPSVAAVKRLIDSALAGEAQGLKGRAYLDKGGPHKQGEEWLDQCGKLIEQLNYPLSIDTEKPQFSWKDRMDAPALYFGWWTHVPNGPFDDPLFRLPSGSVAIHISSFSGDALRQPSMRWSGGFVERGVAATVGNVYEPYLQLTHQPHLFLEALVDGMSTGEAAYYSLQGLSWMTIFLGDPLYQPFKVSLDEQLTNVKADNSLDQYVILREAERIGKESGKDAAFEYQRRGFNRAPGLALAYAIAQGWEERNERTKAVKQLEFVAQMGTFTPEDFGLAYQIAEMLIGMNERETGYQIIRTLANEARSDEAKMTFMQSGIPLANQFREREYAVKWETEIAAIKRKRAELAERRKAAREAAKKK